MSPTRDTSTQAVTLALAKSGLAPAVSDYNGMSASIVVFDGMQVTRAVVLSADQRMLVGEPACDKGFAPESSASGTPACPKARMQAS